MGTRSNPNDGRAGRKIDPARWEHFTNLRRSGWALTPAAKAANIDYRAAKKFEEGDQTSSGWAWRQANKDLALPAPIEYDELSDEAKQGWDDFEFFRRYYLGSVSTPWQIEAAETIRELLSTPHKEYVVINCPPGSGKTRLFTHDLPAWLITRDRAIRTLLGHRVATVATQYGEELIRTFLRTDPLLAPTELVNKGLAAHAEAALAQHYGRYKPNSNDVWTKKAFVVEQMGNALLARKERTVETVGWGSTYIGLRPDFINWDDVVDMDSIGTKDQIEKDRNYWESVAEARLEPSGLLLLTGQRLGADDLFRYCLDMTADSDNPDNELKRTKYVHIKYPAHDETQCREEHSKDAPAWPKGCLLDPKRLEWRELSTVAQNRNDRYRVVYQQEDVDPGSVLVQKVWLDGGVDARGFHAPGCYDDNRAIGEVPAHLAGDLLSIGTVDPSPTKFWSIQWWIFQFGAELGLDAGGGVENGFRYLIDIERKSMGADEFLDWQERDRKFVGILEDWQRRSVQKGAPITHWIVETNAAQKFLLQYDYVARWISKWGVEIIPHDTNRNKSDPDFGVQTIGQHYKFGRKRLPHFNDLETRSRVASLTNELTRWPHSYTDDCVMGDWFGEWAAPDLYTPPQSEGQRLDRPSWMQDDEAELVGSRW